MIGNRGGRPPTAAEAGQKVTLSIRTTPATKAHLLAAAAEEGANLSETAEALLRAALDDRQLTDDIVQNAFAMMLGDDDAGLALLIACLLGELRLRGAYLEDAEKFDDLGRSIGHLLRRLRAPEYGRVVRDNSIEGRVDKLLFELGDPGDAQNSPNYLQRWATGKRRQFGASLAARLIKMHRSTVAALHALSPVDHIVDPEIAALWNAAIAAAAKEAK